MADLILAIVMAVHTLMAVLWTGGYLVTSMLVIPAARRNDAPGFALDVLDSLKWVALGGVVLMGATGGAALAFLYDNTLPEGPRGTAIVAMMVLYGVFALTSAWAWRETKNARADGGSARGTGGAPSRERSEYDGVAELPTRLKMAFRTNALVATLLVLDAATIGYVA